MNAVDDNLQRVIESVRTQEEEFENREQARREEEARQEQIRCNTRPRSLGYEAVTSTPLREQAPYPTTSNRQTNRAILFDPNPTRHSYAQARDSNGSDGYDQLSSDSFKPGTRTQTIEYHQQVIEIQPASDETIGSEITQQDTEPERPDHLVVQVSKTNTQIIHRETQ